jgi:hypothetical protein
VPLVILPGVEVVAGPDHVEPGLFGQDAVFDQLLRRELLVQEPEPEPRVLAGFLAPGGALHRHRRSFLLLRSRPPGCYRRPRLPRGRAERRGAAMLPGESFLPAP